MSEFDDTVRCLARREYERLYAEHTARQQRFIPASVASTVDGLYGLWLFNRLLELNN